LGQTTKNTAKNKIASEGQLTPGEALHRIKRAVYRAIESLGGDVEAYRFAMRRFEEAARVFTREAVDYIVPDREYRSRVKPASTDEVDFYSVHVSPERLKCTCKDSVMTSTAADRALEDYAREEGRYLPDPNPRFPRYSFCKHVLAKAASAAASGAIDLDDPVFRRTLFLAASAAYIRALREAGKRPDPRAMAKVYKILFEVG